MLTVNRKLLLSWHCWHTDDIQVHTSDMRMTCDYYEWHTDNIRVHTSDIRMTFEYIRVTYGWHTTIYEWHTYDIKVHTSDIQMTYEWHTSTYDWHVNEIRNTKLYNGFGAFRLLFSKLFVIKTLLYAGANDFWSLGCSHSHTLVLGSFPFSYFLKFNFGARKPK